jgi:hypothetical protein
VVVVVVVVETVMVQKVKVSGDCSSYSDGALIVVVVVLAIKCVVVISYQLNCL